MASYMADDDPSDEEWAGLETGNRSSRYPVHDACEFEDAETLRRLIFVPQSDDESAVSSDSTSTSTTSSSNEEESHAAAHAAAVGHSPLGVTISAQTALLLKQASFKNTEHNEDTNTDPTPPLHNIPIKAETPNTKPGFNIEAPINSERLLKPKDHVKHTPNQEHTDPEHEKSVDDTTKRNTNLSANCTSDGTFLNDCNDSSTFAHGVQIGSEGAEKPSNGEKLVEEKSTVTNSTILGAGAKQVSPENSHTTNRADETETSNNGSNFVETNPEKKEKDLLQSNKKAKRKKNKYSCPYDLDDRDDDENTPLHIAIHARKLEHVRLLLEAGASVHKKCDGSAPIHLVISIGAIHVHAEFAMRCAELLQSFGTDLTMRDDSLHTPLYLACVSNLCPVVELFLKDPLSKETLNLRADRVGGRALHAAAKFDAVRKGKLKTKGVTELLLSAEGIEIDVQNNYGRTPLHVAASRGNWHVARLLVNAGADVNIVDKRGFSPGQAARKRGMVIPNDLKILGEDSPIRDLIMDPDGNTLILCHELCIQHRTCAPIVRGDILASEPPPENVRRLNVLINEIDGILRCAEFSGCKWNTDVRRAALSDVLKVHDYTYIEKTSQLCSSIPDHPNAIQTLDADTTVSHWSFEAALRAAGSVCEAVDKLMAGDFRNAFCAVRPPGHHAGPRGIVTCPNDPDGSHGFCLLNNVAIGAAYARSMYRNDGINKVAIIDFDVHHGNGTEEIVRQLTPNVEQTVIRTPFAIGGLHTSRYKPWLNENDIDEVFFASTHGYGPRDRQPLRQAPFQGGWFYPASGKTHTSESILSPSNVETPNLSDFLLSQTWTRLGDDYRRNCCKIIDIGLSLPMKDDMYHHGLQRLELRDSYRKNVIPYLLEFDPDIIFISAGFDAHRKDTMNFGYVGMIEEDYEWLTEQLVKVANTCCNGRVVSVLEGGYKIHGGIVSPFARSVASHVRALVDGGSSRELYDKEEGHWESQFERHMIEEKEKKRQMKIDRQTRVAEALRQRTHMLPRQHHAAADRDANEREEATNPDEESHNGADLESHPSKKRRRNQVDYKQLYEQMKKEGFN